MAQNPAWTDKLYAKYCEPIKQFAEKHGLPLPIETGACQIGAEYGKPRRFTRLTNSIPGKNQCDTFSNALDTSAPDCSSFRRS